MHHEFPEVIAEAWRKGIEYSALGSPAGRRGELSFLCGFAGAPVFEFRCSLGRELLRDAGEH